MTLEQIEQTRLIAWTQRPEVRERYPDLKLLYHVPNERKCTPAQGQALKRMGVKRGVPDLCLPVPSGKAHGLYIELKSMAKSTRASDAQLWWMDELVAQGYAVAMCRGWEAARDVIVDYMEGCKHDD